MDEATAALSAEHRRDALVALGASPHFATSNLSERLRGLGEQIDRDIRTVQRRVNGLHQSMAVALAERLVRARSQAGFLVKLGWNVEQLDCDLSFERPFPVLIERREIAVIEPTLDQLTINMTLAGPVAREETPDVEGLDGCAVTAVDSIGGRFLAITLQPPRALHQYERLNFSLRATFPRRDVLAPFYGMAPLRRSQRFSAEVRFADARQVSAVWALNAVPQILFQDASSIRLVGTPVTLEGTTASYRREPLVPGLCYGLAWAWADG